jgi:hypothetical protein
MVVAAAVVGQLPGPVGGWVQAVGTAAHESGHALVADVLTGRVVSVTVFQDGGGVTFSQASSSSWRSFLVSAAGYPATLVLALVALTAVLLAGSSRLVAYLGAIAAFVSWVLWVPWSSRVRGIDGADQHFTWIVFLVSVAVLVGAAALPMRFDTARRVVLGAFAVGLLGDAFRATHDLVVIEGDFGQTATDADGLNEAVGLFSAGVWAWLMRAALFVVFGGWAFAMYRRLRSAPAPAPS